MKGMLLGASLAIAGLLIGFTFATKVDVHAEAKWWDLMTAFGTVGSVVVALAFGLIALISQNRSNRYRANVIGWFVVPTLGQIRAGCELLSECSRSLLQIPSGEIPDDQLRFLWRLTAPMMDARDLLQHISELHLLSARADAIAEIVSEAARLHSLMVRVGDLSSPLGNERGLFSSLASRSDELKELIEQTLARDWPSGKTS
ncbi:hypothetical protein [Achromobacter xylosoxidans]|uniref:hypothetical protein n=1 Tax=Alcaligenes xylosoxydans xylosoxydans TaxID=85698 RepID=UPI0012931E63|nr:hypothetical protein [Achromobacter xylosoxidans]